MDSRIQFRINEETKILAQKNARSKGLSLSNACRDFTEQLAEEQRMIEQHEDWLKEKVDQAFARLKEGTAVVLTHEAATTRMNEFKNRIRAKYHSESQE